MEQNAQIVSDILTRLADILKKDWERYTAKDLDEMAGVMIKEHGAKSYNKGYHPKWAKIPFPANLCVSPNGIVAHGIPSNYHFQEGDLVTLDIGIIKDGLCGDAALTVGCGKLSNENDRLLYYSRKAVYEYISQIKPGVNTRDLAAHITRWANARGFNVNRRGAGHSIGKEMHMKPTFYNTVEDDNHTYADVEVGTYACIEPILTKSKDSTGMVMGDGWTVATFDRKYTAMFEHMIQVTEDGAKILTTHFDEKGGEL